MSAADEQPFLDAVLARYHDDGPRLVYADFLDETGDPADAARAELIRVQVALARLPDHDPRLPGLRDRQAELSAAFHDAWTAPLRELGAAAEFRRGVPDFVSIDAAAFLDRGEELFRRAPAVRRVRLLDAGREMPRLVQCPLLGRIEDLDLGVGELGNAGVEQLVRSPHLARVRVLDLGFNGLDDAGVAAVARASSLAGLRELALNDNGQITAEGVRLLAESPFFARLEGLDLSGNDVNEGGVRALARSRSLPALRSVKLAQNPIGDAGIEELLAPGEPGPLLARLLAHDPRLDLRKNGVGPAGVEALARSPLFAQVASLDLSGNYLGDRGFAALLGLPHAARLRVLRLANNQVTDAGVLAGRGEVARLARQLRCLDLAANRLTRVGIGAVAAAWGDRHGLDTSGNVEPRVIDRTPVQVGEVMTDVLDGVAELRRRVANPAQRRGRP